MAPLLGSGTIAATVTTPVTYVYGVGTITAVGIVSSSGSALTFPVTYVYGAGTITAAGVVSSSGSNLTTILPQSTELLICGQTLIICGLNWWNYKKGRHGSFLFSFAASTATFSAPTNASPSVSSNVIAFNFPQATALWGTVTYFGIFSTPTGGVPLAFGALNSSQVVNAGNVLTFGVGQITIT